MRFESINRFDSVLWRIVNKIELATIAGLCLLGTWTKVKVIVP